MYESNCYCVNLSIFMYTPKQSLPFIGNKNEMNAIDVSIFQLYR